MNIVWKTVPSWSKFEVNNLGEIRHVNGKPKYINISKQGYVVLQTKLDGKIKTLKLHRLVAETFLEPPSEDLITLCSKTHWGIVCVNHIDGNKLNNKVENLEWCTQEYNNKHANATNLVPALKGSLNGRSKLNENTVHEICLLFQNTNIKTQDVADKFNISLSQVQKIRCGIAWKHIWCQYSIKVNKRTTNPND